MTDTMPVSNIKFDELKVEKAVLINRINRIISEESELELCPFGHKDFQCKIKLGAVLAAIPFNLLIGDDIILSDNELLKDLNYKDLPYELTEVASMLILSEKITKLEELIDSKISLKEPFDDFNASFSLDFILKTEKYDLPLRLEIISVEAVKLIISRLKNIEPKKNNLKPNLLFSFIVGEGKLNLEELKNLECGDVLIFNKYYLENNNIYVKNSKYIFIFEKKNTDLELVACEFNENLNSKGKNMSENNENSSHTIDPNNLEFKVEFELSRKLMTLDEISTLKIGSVIALGKDIQSPIAIIVNDKKIGDGKIVDLGGTLGVQITSLQK